MRYRRCSQSQPQVEWKAPSEGGSEERKREEECVWRERNAGFQVWVKARSGAVTP